MKIQFLTVTSTEILNTIPEDGIYYSFEKENGNVKIAIDYNKADEVHCYDENDRECTAFIVDGIYEYIKTFYGSDSLENAVKYANQRATSKYLSINN